MRVKIIIAVLVVGIVQSVFASVGTRGTFTDPRDGKTYKTVVMPDAKTWMAENLNFATNSGSWCYDNNAANCNTYGRLYDWNTAMNACPAGWRLPSNDEWTVLIGTVGSNAGTKLKSAADWQPDSRTPIGTDAFGFSALPGGYYIDETFNDVGFFGYWWTATDDGASDARVRLMYYNNDETFSNWYNKTLAFSVRCVKD